MLSGYRFRYQRIKNAHEHTAGNADPDSPHTDRATLALSPAIRERVKNNRQHDQRHTAKEQSGMTLRRNDIIQENAHHQRQPDSNRKGDSQASDIDGRYQKQVGDIEHRAASYSEQHVRGVGLTDVAE